MNPVRNLHTRYFMKKMNSFNEKLDKIKGGSVNF